MEISAARYYTVACIIAVAFVTVALVSTMVQCVRKYVVSREPRVVTSVRINAILEQIVVRRMYVTSTCAAQKLLSNVTVVGDRSLWIALLRKSSKYGGA